MHLFLFEFMEVNDDSLFKVSAMLYDDVIH